MRPEPAADYRSPRVLLRVIALAGSSLLAAAVLVIGMAPPASGFDVATAEATFWQLLQADRTNNGLAPFTKHGTLMSIARWRSQDMVDRDYFSHTILGTGYNVSHWYDLNGIAWSAWAENIAWNNGYSDSQSIIEANNGLMGSSAHRANILNAAFTHAGVGVGYANNITWQGKLRSPRVYTQLFLKPKSVSSTPAPTPTPPPPPPPSGTPKPTSSPPPPPPSGTAAPTPAATPLPTAEPTATPLPTPQSTASPDAKPVVVWAPGDHTETRFMAGVDTREVPTHTDPPLVATTYRIEPAQLSGGGLFEALFSTLIGFLFG